MRPPSIVVLPPAFNSIASFGHRFKQVFVQALVSQSAIEALDNRVLNRLSRLNEAQVNAFSPCPSVQVDSSELRPVVELQSFGQAPLVLQPIENANHAIAVQS